MTTEFHPPYNLLATIGDPEGTRTVTSIVALLVAIGLALAMVAVWMYRTTRPDPELLAPLEMMGERKWRRADPVAQRRTLDEVRPQGAKPLAPSAAPPTFDEAFDQGPTAAGFDDLHGDADEVGAPPGVAAVASAFSNDLEPPAAEVTPVQLDRPVDHEFGDEIDPEVLAAARAELESELRKPSDTA